MIITLVRSSVDDRFYSSGHAVVQVGWKVLDIAIAKKTKANSGERQRGGRTEAAIRSRRKVNRSRFWMSSPLRRRRERPKRFTEGTLLTAMETAGKTLDDKELSQAMKENGLGTPATRAQIIEVLLKREFIVRRGKSLEATDKGHSPDRRRASRGEESGDDRAMGSVPEAH